MINGIDMDRYLQWKHALNPFFSRSAQFKMGDLLDCDPTHFDRVHDGRLHLSKMGCWLLVCGLLVVGWLAVDWLWILDSGWWIVDCDCSD